MAKNNLFIYLSEFVVVIDVCLHYNNFVLNLKKRGNYYVSNKGFNKR